MRKAEHRGKDQTERDSCVGTHTGLLSRVVHKQLAYLLGVREKMETSDWEFT